VTRSDANHLQVTGPMWLLVKPKTYYGIKTFNGFTPDISGTDSSGAIDLEDATVYVSQISFYKRVWVNENACIMNFNNAGVVTTQALTATIVYPEEGIFHLGGNIPCTCFLSTGPANRNSAVSVTISYLSGDSLEDWQTVIARLALANMNRFICGCDSPEWARWQQNAANIGGPTADLYKVSQQWIDNPLGTMAGAIFAWQNIIEKRLIQGLAI
jgi:hypothetical protein